MELSLGSLFFGIYKKILSSVSVKAMQFIDNLLFVKHLCISHDHYLRRAYKPQWHTLGEVVSFSIHVPHILLSVDAASTIFVVKKNTDQEVESATIVVSAESSDVIFQETIVVDRLLTDKPIITSLASIPPLEFYIKDDMIKTNYREIRVSLSTVKIGGKIKSHDNVVHITPSISRTLCLNKEFKLRCGKVYNVELINNKKEELAGKILSLFPGHIRILRIPPWSAKSFAELFALKMLQIARYIVLNNYFISIVFWPAVFLGLLRLTNESDA